MSTINELASSLSFLDELGWNNNRAWFDQHRARYEAARGAFERLIDELIARLRVSDQLEGLSAKDCIFRLNRDVRFSKDKSPYKTNLGAVIAPGGKKSSRLGYYIHLAPRDGTMIAGGLHMPEPGQLARFRQAIDRDAGGLKKIISSKSFVAHFGTIQGERLVTAPQGYSRTHPEIGLLQLKQVTAAHHFTDGEVSSSDFAAQVVEACHAMKPFLTYLDSILQPE